MGQASIPVDLFNPGQVFACLGFLEAADVLLGNAEGGFNWEDEKDIRFNLRVSKDVNPFSYVLEFLADASVVAMSPYGSGRTDQWGIETVVESREIFPINPQPKENGKRAWIKESALPVKLRVHDKGEVLISYWADVDNGRLPLKTWGGAKGKSGALRIRDLLVATSDLVKSDPTSVSADPFNASSPVSGLRLEMRRDYVPMDIGFSLNPHKSYMTAQGFPMVEILAAIGLEHARPVVIDRLHYRFGVWNMLFSPDLARPALGCSITGSELRTFVAVLGEPNKYDRSILFSKEENRA